MDKKKNTEVIVEDHLNPIKIVEELRIGIYDDYDQAKSMSGKIADLNGWCSSLSTNKMIRWTFCENVETPPDLGKYQ